MNYIKDAGLNFKRTPSKRSLTKGIIIHHPAAFTMSPQQIHTVHLNRGWIGAGYNIYVRKDGTVWALRGLDAVGAHTSGHNNNTIGVCVEGYFHPRNGQYDKEMSEIQYNAVVRLLKDLLKKYSSIEFIKGHSDFAATACPGNTFPLKNIVSDVYNKNYNQGGNKVSVNYLNMPVLRRGDRGNWVVILQEALLELGYNLQQYGADGSFGGVTETAVRQFQKDNKLQIDGVFGPQSRAKLDELMKARQKEDVYRIFVDGKQIVALTGFDTAKAHAESQKGSNIYIQNTRTEEITAIKTTVPSTPSPNNTTIAKLEKEINDLKKQISDLQKDVSSRNTTITNLNKTVGDLNKKITDAINVLK